MIYFTINRLPQCYLCFHNSISHIIKLLIELHTEPHIGLDTELFTERYTERPTEILTDFLIEPLTDFPNLMVGVITTLSILLNY